MSEKRKDSKGRLLRTGESQRKDGRYEYKFIDVNGIRRSVYSWKLVETDRIPAQKRCKMSLRELEKQLQDDVKDGLDGFEARNTTVEEYYQKICLMDWETKDSTQYCKDCLYRAHIRSYFGNKKFTEITYSMIWRWFAQSEENGLSPTSIVQISHILTQLFSYAIRDKLIRENTPAIVLSDLRRKNPSKWKAVPRLALSKREQDTFVMVIQESNVKSTFKHLIMILLGTGLRIGEALGLTWDDCDLEGKKIFVNHTFSKKRDEITGKMRVGITTPKSQAGERVVPMFEMVKDEFITLKKEQKAKGVKSIELDGYSNFIFINSKGNIISPDSIRNAISRTLKRYNEKEKRLADDGQRKPLLLPPIVPHTLRHTFCTRLCENGANLKVVQSVMGHASIAVTMNIYNSLTEEFTMEHFRSLDGNNGLSKGIPQDSYDRMYDKRQE